MAGKGSEFGGAHRFDRPIDACELAQGLENTPQRRVSLESNERKFLSLASPGCSRGLWPTKPKCRRIRSRRQKFPALLGLLILRQLLHRDRCW